MSFYAANYVDKLVLREQSVPSPKGPLSFTQMMEQQNCKLTPLFSKVDTGLVLNAAIHSVREWTETGKPAAPTLKFQRDAKNAVIRDADGKVMGGVRLAQFSVPTAYTTLNGEAPGCVLSGHHRDFSKAELKTRYANHQTYVSQVKTAMEEVRKNGYLLPFDEEAAVLEAEKSDVAQ